MRQITFTNNYEFKRSIKFLGVVFSILLGISIIFQNSEGIPNTFTENLNGFFEALSMGKSISEIKTDLGLTTDDATIVILAITIFSMWGGAIFLHIFHNYFDSDQVRCKIIDKCSEIVTLGIIALLAEALFMKIGWKLLFAIINTISTVQNPAIVIILGIVGLILWIIFIFPIFGDLVRLVIYLLIVMFTDLYFKHLLYNRNPSTQLSVAVFLIDHKMILFLVTVVITFLIDIIFNTIVEMIFDSLK